MHKNFDIIGNVFDDVVDVHFVFLFIVENFVQNFFQSLFAQFDDIIFGFRVNFCLFVDDDDIVDCAKETVEKQADFVFSNQFDALVFQTKVTQAQKQTVFEVVVQNKRDDADELELVDFFVPDFVVVLHDFHEQVRLARHGLHLRRRRNEELRRLHRHQVLHELLPRLGAPVEKKLAVDLRETRNFQRVFEEVEVGNFHQENFFIHNHKKYYYLIN